MRPPFTMEKENNQQAFAKNKQTNKQTKNL
jgi:hypothetical protein